MIACHLQGKRSKTRRPSLTKLRIKFPIKGKAREATKRNHVQVLLLPHCSTSDSEESSAVWS